MQRASSHRDRFIPGIALVLAVVWWAILPSAALAHAEQAKADPTPGAVLSRAPTRVDVWFTEHLTAKVSMIQVYDVAGRRVDQGDTQIDPGDTLHMSVTLDPLSPGTYTVVWSNVSADDGHPNRGGFAFTVLTPTPMAQAAAPLGAGTPAPTSVPTPAPTPLPLPSQSAQAVADLLNPATDRPTAAVDLVSGWLTFGTLVLAGGGAVFALLCLLPALGRAGPEGRALGTTLNRRFSFLVLLSALVGGAAAFISLVAKAEIATGLPPGDLLSGTVLSALLDSWAGHVWIAREAAFGGMLVAAAALLWMSRARRGKTPAISEPPKGKQASTMLRPALPATADGQKVAIACVALLGAVGLVCQAWDSHLAAGHVARPGPLGTVDLSLHLLAMGLWVGGLAYAALLLRPIWQRLPTSLQTAIAADAVARFSPLALVSVVVIVISGTYAAVLLFPTLSDLLTSAYGQALDVKIALFLVLILFGAANRRTLAGLAHGKRGDQAVHSGAGEAPTSRAATASRATSRAAVVGAAGRHLIQAMRREFVIAAGVLLAAATMLEVGPPGVALAGSAVKLEVAMTLPALPATPAPLQPTPTPRPTLAPPVYTSTAKTSDLLLHLRADPAVVGATSTLTVDVTDANGAPTTGAEVKLRLTAQAIDLGTQVLTATAVAPGTYRVVAPAFAAPGSWQVLLVVRRDNFPEVDTSFIISVRAPAPVPTPTPLPSATPTPAPETLRAVLALQPDPPAVGSAAATLRLQDGSDHPIAGAHVQVLWLMPQHAHLTQTTLKPLPDNPGAYASDVDLSMAGAWLADASVTTPDGRTAHLQFAFNVRARGLLGEIAKENHAW